MLRNLLSALFILCTVSCTAQYETVKLFPGGAPGEKKKMTVQEDRSKSVGGRPILCITDVGEPEITIFPAPEATASGAAMIVCPGGGYRILAYDHEGTEVCDWLNKAGITAVLLKYRVPAREGRERYEAALQDVQRAIGYVRYHAKKLHVDPSRIGVMGFSAGAHLSATASNRYSERSYPAVDAADKESCRPDFCLLVYPAYLDGKDFQTAPEIRVTSNTPPTMIIQTEDDKNYINSSLFYYYALKEAGVPAWMHLYSKGGHGYGLRDTGAAVNEWPRRVEEWFRELNLTNRK